MQTINPSNNPVLYWIEKNIVAIFIGILFLRAFFSLTVGYVDDDAYHWTWTRQMDWSYFDHPGMIAWLEWISTGIFGHNRLGIRLPGFICFALVIYLMFQFTKKLFDRPAALFTCGLLLFAPLWGFGGFVASPEPPFILLWVLAMIVFWQGVRPDEERWSLKKTWLTLGLIMGLGFNTKFPMVMIAPGFGLYLLVTKERRKDLLSIWPWVGVLIAAAFLLPVLLWNLKYDWPSFRFQFHERHTGSDFDVNRWLGYLGMQAGLLSPGVFVVIWLSLIVSFQKFLEPRWRLLCCLSLPSFFIFYPQPLWADFKPHWMGPAYLILAIGAGAIWSLGWKLGGRQLIRPLSRKMFWWVWGFIIPMNFLIYAPMVYPWVPKVARMISPDKPWDIKNDVSNEVFGWPEAGEKALELQERVFQETGRKPFLAGHRYEMTAQIWKATMQKTYMLSRTRSHFTTVTTEAEYDSLKGQDAIMVSNNKYELDPMEFAAFDSCTKEEFRYFRADELARIFYLHWCKNFQGIKK